MGKFTLGTVFGVLLSLAYVWYDVELPEWVQLPDTLQRSLKAAATDDTLYDLAASPDTRRRALEVYFANQSKRAAGLDADLGHPLLSELVRRRVRRQAQIMRGLWTAYDTALAKPALRQKLIEKHGAEDDVTLKRRMLLAALNERPFLRAWLARNRAAVTEANIRETLIAVSRLKPRIGAAQGDQ